MPHNCFQHQRILLGFLKDHDNEEIQLSHQRNKLHFAIYSHRKQLFLNCDKINCNFNPINAGKKQNNQNWCIVGGLAVLPAGPYSNLQAMGNIGFFGRKIIP